jgi:dihydroorotate dehydrogenase electron transfer subunit
MLRVAGDSDPLLARPFGISGFDRKKEGVDVEIIYRVVGRGTGIMERWRSGQRAVFLGPLGRGFALPPEGSSSLLVAGGVGLPPLLALARKMEALGRIGELSLVYGEASRDRLVDLKSGLFPGVESATCTEDGSCGTRGLVTGLLEARDYGEGRHLFVCGPNPMMKAVMDLVADRCLSAQYSLEARMACGFGVCSGCAVMVSSRDYVRVCREGPVFNGSELSGESFGEI